MNQNTHNNSDGLNQRDWQLADQLIESIIHDKDMENPDAAQRINQGAMPDQDRESFFSAIQRDYKSVYRKDALSLVERWSAEHIQINWLAKLKNKLNTVRAANKEAWGELQAYFEALQSTVDILSTRMIPAPVHRSAVASQQELYQPRRRAIEPADLPAFSPLFCTAIDPDAEPFIISGLAPEVEHRLTLVCIQKPSIKHEETIGASGNGTVQIDLAKTMITLQDNLGDFCEFTWFLTEKSGNGAWASGMVWLESKATRRLANEAVRMLVKKETKESEDSCIDSLFEINLLATRETYMEAYEQARQGLLFMPRQQREENSVPFKESLWLFLNHLIDKIVDRMEKAEPVFQSIKPDWNAVNSLKTLKERLTEWE
jgi:hypothetical protein